MVWWRHLAATLTSIMLGFGAIAQSSVFAQGEEHASSFTEQGTSEEDLSKALKTIPRGSNEPLPGSVEEQRLIDRIRTDRTRQKALNRPITPTILDIKKPSIDLAIQFEYNSAAILPSSKPELEKLGRALTGPDLVGDVFVIAGHTDAAGSDEYTQNLSERRADAVKLFLTENFAISSEDLVAVGYGKSRLKNPSEPLAADNRRIEIINMGGRCRRRPSSAPFC